MCSVHTGSSKERRARIWTLQYHLHLDQTRIPKNLQTPTCMTTAVMVCLPVAPLTPAALYKNRLHCHPERNTYRNSFYSALQLDSTPLHYRRGRPYHLEKNAHINSYKFSCLIQLNTRLFYKKACCVARALQLVACMVTYSSRCRYSKTFPLVSFGMLSSTWSRKKSVRRVRVEKTKIFSVSYGMMRCTWKTWVDK